MALNAIDSLFGNRVSPAPNVLSYVDEEKTKETRIVLSKTSYTRDDGSVVTTTRYSDGTTETSVTDGDAVILSAAAQNLFKNRV